MSKKKPDSIEKMSMLIVSYYVSHIEWKQDVSRIWQGQHENGDQDNKTVDNM